MNLYDFSISLDSTQELLILLGAFFAVNNPQTGFQCVVSRQRRYVYGRNRLLSLYLNVDKLLLLRQLLWLLGLVVRKLIHRLLWRWLNIYQIHLHAFVDLLSSYNNLFRFDEWRSNTGDDGWLVRELYAFLVDISANFALPLYRPIHKLLLGRLKRIVEYIA